MRVTKTRALEDAYLRFIVVGKTMKADVKKTATEGAFVTLESRAGCRSNVLNNLCVKTTDIYRWFYPILKDLFTLMKRILFTSLVIVCWLQLTAQYNYKINGTGFLLADNQRMYLKIWKDVDKSGSPCLDSVTIRDGQFMFQGEMANQSAKAQLYVISNSKLESFNFVVDSGVNIISSQGTVATSELFFSITLKPNSLSNEIDSRIDTLYQYYLEKYGTFTEDLTNGGQIFVLNNYEKIIDQNKEILSLVSQYPSSFYTLIELYNLLYSTPFRKDPTDLMKVFYQLVPKLQNDALGRKFYKECSFIIAANNASQIGNQVPLFEVATSDGKAFSTKSMTGKTYIIAFSATWCIPCQYYKKLLISLYKRYRGDGLHIVYFNLDDDAGKWKEEIEKIALDWIFVSENVKFENSKIARSFNVYSIPSYFLIDRAGVIKYNSVELKDMEFVKLESFIKKEIEK